MSNLVVRSIEEGDIEVLSSIISETWDFQGSFTTKLAQKMGRLYLAESLAKSNFNKVAVIDGKTAGIITARSENKKAGNFKAEWFLIKSLVPVLLNHETVKALRIFNETEKLNERLMDKTKTSFDAEIPLFVMDKNYRGRGIGKKLFEEALSYMKKNGSSNYFVYTDTTCDYRFYEHNGAEKLASESLIIPI